ncbi:MAG: hypothetical protein ABI867_40365 [Kofleriaceae bacterium]
MKQMKRTRLERAQTLTNAKLTAVRGGDGKIAVTYQKIETIWKEGNITGLDDWQKTT